ncbi:MAG: hypothetical protein ACAI25_01765 [Planctomycetota bacterium]
MASHFGAIGFAVVTAEEYEALGVLAGSVGKAHGDEEQTYVRWEAGTGVEIWAQADRGTKKIKGLTPYFASGEAALDGTIERVDPHPKRLHEGSIALVPTGDERRAALAGVPVTLPDFRLALPRLAPRAPARMSLAAFAHAFEVLESEKALGDSGLAPGMMLRAAQGLALATGRVVRSDVRTNPSGRREFVWALLAVQGGTLDVLLDPVLRDTPLEEGQVCRGVFWLSGRLSA